jgi:hypothetical protein
MVGPNITGRYVYVAMIETVEGWSVITAHWMERRRAERLYNSWKED